MKCPNCPDTTLTMADHQGIEIDYCPQCRGVWLDRGELDKLMERAAEAATPAHVAAAPLHQPPQQPHYQPPHQQQYARPHGQPDFVDSDDRHRGHAGYGYTKRKKSWMSEIFD